MKQGDLPGLAHDLNNVFQTLTGVAAHLDHDPDLAAAIHRSVERGRHILTSIENGAGEVTPFEIILANSASFLNDFRLAANAPPVAIESSIEPGIQLRGHWAWERVLINLFLNSLRAMPAGGTISVTARYKGSTVEIRVADSGTGIAPELLGHLFEPHVSGNGSSGLGLNIVESIVSSNGGRIHAANRAANRTTTPGAEFVITVPALTRDKAHRARA